jgi:Domain of unknown function (DUF4864)
MTKGQKGWVLVMIFSCCAAGAIATHLIRQRAEEEFDPKPLYGVIYSQFRACLQDDFRTAYDEASVTTQRHFTLVEFASRIRTKYGTILRPQKLEFAKTSLQGSRAFVEVYFVNGDRQVTPALFTMIQEQGQWRIENFEIFESWPSDRRIAGSRA